VRVPIPTDGPLLVLLSGGGDSVALLDLAVRAGAQVSALHVNYGLRDGADEDEAFVRSLCERLGVPLFAESVALGDQQAGNLQERARDARYALAERLASGLYATGHTASDQAETVLYRLGVTREEVRAYLRSRGLEWREDPSNADRRFARVRVRHDLLETLRTIGPAAELTITETARQLREEAEVLDVAVDTALAALGGGPSVSLPALREHPRAVQRLVLRRLAGDRPVPDSVLAIDDRGTKTLDLSDGLRVVVEYGTLRFTRAAEAPAPEPVSLPVPGRVRFGDWELEAARGGVGDVSVRLPAAPLVVRAWRSGDRMRPLGVGGTKTLQDLFTDRKVPRALRHTLPVVESEGEIVWVAGVAVDERVAADEADPDAVALSARALPPASTRK
jgi:tRNA(Ile)-lysidine synthase